ncbi:helix-turn-helix transcriptional regulator [Streptomyces sp. NPDC002769]|uniref:helix-turn-helix domain-containing protein n=1 Tax=Streptomyces sp. NPDC002769 TaxID=3154542 RepID=UPI00331D2A4D
MALLASISGDYYTRLEQGRRQASQAVPETLAEVLRLDDDERAYMFAWLARTRPGRVGDPCGRSSPSCGGCWTI